MMKRLYVLTFLIVLLVGCAKVESTPETMVTPASPEATDVLPTVTLTHAPTATAIPEATKTPKPTPTITNTPVPTLEPNADVPDRWTQAANLGRGVNLGNALEAPAEGDWGMVIEEDFFGLIAEAGFDTIRVPIRWSAHAMTEAPYTVDENFFMRVDWVIDQGLSNGLNVVINMHHYEELFSKPAEHRDRFIAIWQQIAERYKDKPLTLYYEPLNEPHDRLVKTNWTPLQIETILAIRRIDNTHTLVLTGASWGGIDGLVDIKVPEGEENYLCTFHYYQPMLFTHQNAGWVGDEYKTTGLTWPGPPDVEITPVPEAAQTSWVATWFDQYNTFPPETNPAGRNEIEDDFDWALRLGNGRDCPLWLGEFGVYETADMQSRVNWTTAMREIAEERGISWSYWEFGAGFGVYDRDNDVWYTELRNALIPAE